MARPKYDPKLLRNVPPFTKAGNVEVVDLDGRFVVFVDGVAKYRTKTRQGADNIAAKLYTRWCAKELAGWPPTIAAATNPAKTEGTMRKIKREIARLDRAAASLSRRMRRRNPGDVDRVLDGYLEAAVWASTDDDEAPLDRRYSVRDFTKAAGTAARKDVKEFLRRAGALIDASGRSDGQIGHDFWLTRNGHGTGFWDRDLGDVGDKLTDIAHAFGESNVYVSRGKLHLA